MAEKLIHLGFAEAMRELDEEVDEGVKFISKIGGKPTWLNYSEIINGDEIRCSRCDKPMTFLMQLYAPKDDINEGAFHRMLYIFLCPTGACIKGTVLSQDNFISKGVELRKPSIAVLRCQLPKVNAFFDADSENPEISYKKENVKEADQCRISGLNGKFSCSQCQRVRYASKEHQAFDWKLRHKAECKLLVADNQIDKPLIDKTKSLASVEAELASQKKEETSSNIIFEESEIVTDPAEEKTQTNPDPNAPESDEEESDTDEDELDPKKEEERLKRNEELIRKHSVTTKEFDKEDIKVQELVDQPKAVKDKFFLNFQRYIEKEPEQILRYYEDESTEALWVNKDHRLPAAKIPKCESCGGPRRVEFQILPQLLYVLNMDEAAVDDSLDFGTIAIYTCLKSCSLKKPYAAEYAWIQPIQEDV